jgi:hypothetical protein
MKNMSTYTIITLLFICTNYTFSQSTDVSGSIIYEGSIQYEKKYNNDSGYKNRAALYPFNLKLGLIIQPNREINFELRTGFYYGGDFYSGIELDLISRYRIINNLYIGGRVVLHHNISGGSGGNEIYERIVSGLFGNLGIGFDYLFYSNFALELYYIKHIQQEYGYTKYDNFILKQSLIYKRYLFHTVKFGLRYIF